MSNSNTIFKKSDFYPKGVLISKLNNISGSENIINILYTDLYTLRSESKLVPGQSYRITDYITTTTQTDTQSASNQFDIIVEALDENTLSENVSAVQHDGDTYFTNVKLESWELKYCIDNDTNRFAWADSVDGKGVIYYMKDEWGNECPYDFKNIQYFKNSVWVYTFGGTIDNSLVASCSNNIINPYISSNKQTLNNITFGTNCYSNTFGVNCYYNTFGYGCHSNTFGVNCYYNTFGYDCHSNTFGYDCHSNTFGNSCRSNTFGYYCFSNTFGFNCNSNTFGDGCQSNIFSENDQLNTFGINCAYNIFGVSCDSNIFGNSCSSNTFGDSCWSNIFGNVCRSNKFYHGSSGTTKKNYIRYIVLEDGVSRNNFYSNLTTSNNIYLQRIRIKGLENATQTNTTITLPATNTNYNWVIAKNSSSVVEQYCPENLVDVSIISLTYATLVNLRDNGQLVPGQSYRITNYITTTRQTNTQSAGNQFDIIVTALSTNKLSENAKCVKKDSDTYFTNAKLESWELKYCLDNDTNRFAWADSVNGKGVIYYMKDEWGNECPYDFKNIQFKKSNIFLYTFGYTVDNSLTGGCHHNTMMDFILSSILKLNFNTFGNGCHSNTFGYNCESNTFGFNCTSNTFGDSCYQNTFGHNCNYNTFDHNCNYNTFGDTCFSNTFGRGSRSNTFGDSCYSNTFGNYCYSNNFYHDVSGTTKKNYIRHIVLENSVSNNNFYSELTTSSESYLQRIRIKGLEHTTPTDTIITLPATNTKYEWLICYKSDGTLKQYCPND